MKRVPTLAGCRNVVLDTMVFIYLFEDQPSYGTLCEELIRQVEKKIFSGLITPITAAEILVKPLRAKRADIADRYRQALANLPNITPCTFTAETGFIAGALRAHYGLPLPDMLQAAAALQYGEGILITNDRHLRRITELRVILLDDMARP